MTLYTKPGCPKCDILIRKLDMKGATYNRVNDIEEIVRIGEEQGINTAPILEIDGEYLDFSHANTYINNMVEVK